MIVIIMDGGLVQGVATDEPELVGKQVKVMDYDVEGTVDDDEDIVKIPQNGDLDDTEDARVSTEIVGVLEGAIAEVLRGMP